MKKTFDQLTVGDKIYVARVGDTKFEEKDITKVDSSHIHYGYSDTLKRFPTTETESKASSYYDHHYYKYFTHKPDCIRYARAQMMKELFKKIETAKSYISEVHKFREVNHDLLNHEWTDRQLNILEKQLGY